MINFIRRYLGVIRQPCLLRIKRDISDYSEIGDFKLQALSQLQKSYCSLTMPAPDGFEIDFGRKALPTGDKE